MAKFTTTIVTTTEGIENNIATQKPSPGNGNYI
jgi:hypothetical protein